MDARDARDARDAMAARDAMDARDARDARENIYPRAMQRFAQWCIQSWGWGYWRWELSWIATTQIGALQNNKPAVSAWAEPVYEAYCAGAWILHWTDDTLYWAAKPIVHTELVDGQKRLHCSDGPALESAIENLYFWHGVLVPAFAVTYPEWITIDHIRKEENAEVRRIMMERMGWGRFCDQAGMKVIHEDELHTKFPNLPVSDLVDEGQRLVTTYREGIETAQLLEAEGLTDFEDRPLRFVRLTDPSTNRRYTIRVLHSHTRCYEAIGWTFNMTEEAYKTSVLQHS